MKAILNTLLTIFILIGVGCTTPVAVDPQTGQDQNAKFRTGNFYGPLDADIRTVFRTAIRELDAMGYHRTGELHEENYINIYARNSADDRIVLRSYYPRANANVPEGGESMLRIRVGTMGNLSESQRIYGRIRDAL